MEHLECLVRNQIGVMLEKFFEKQHYGNLLRGNTIFMNYGTIELRLPFFDTEFLNYN